MNFSLLFIRSQFFKKLEAFRVLFMSRPKSKNNGDHLKPNHLVDPIALIEKKRWSARLSNGKRFMLSYQFLQFSIEIYAHLFKRAFKSFQFNLRMRKLIMYFRTIFSNNHHLHRFLIPNRKEIKAFCAIKVVSHGEEMFVQFSCFLNDITRKKPNHPSLIQCSTR